MAGIEAVAGYAIVLAMALVSPRLVAPGILVWAVVAFIFQDRPYGNGHYLFPTWYHLCFPVFALYFAAGILARYRFNRNSKGFRHYGVLAAVAFCCGNYVLAASFWIVFVLLFIWTLPFSMLFGRLDVHLQSRLKGIEAACLARTDRSPFESRLNRTDDKKAANNSKLLILTDDDFTGGTAEPARLITPRSELGF